jgi:hypothetical protein
MTENICSAQKEICEFDKLNPPDNPEDTHFCRGPDCDYCGKFAENGEVREC